MVWLSRYLRPAGGAPRAWSALELGLFLVYAGALILWCASLFFGSMRLQLGYSEAHARGAVAPFSEPRPQPEVIVPGVKLAPVPPAAEVRWSAPLDDVFIHFDFARSTARGYPFQWSEGNGYSSGGTSLLYPFALALGYWGGFRGLALMHWAGIVACISCLAFLIAARRLFSGLPKAAAWLAPPALLCVGALSWSLFSGMEVAFFLALWGACLVAWDDLMRAPELWPSASPTRQAAVLGLAGLFMVATRPEAATLIALFGCSAAAAVLTRRDGRTAFLVLVLSGLPALLVLLGHGFANQWFTGYSTAAGALVKLEMHHPHLSSEQVFDAWWFHVKYQVMRVTHYHLSEPAGFGWIVWALGLIALIPRATRRYAAMLWASAALWVLVVAMNGQVRWQNERYSMPALTWLLMNAALGVGALVSLAPALGARGRRLRLMGGALATVLVFTFIYFQLPRYREQVWFFGRASRNIRDQHIATGQLLAHLRPARVLVGDAGAITYESDLPGLDIIGLGGYQRYPFARASQWGVPAILELIQRIPVAERPELMAIYPGWWGTLPLWFGEPIAHAVVRGNVICGGADKVIYRPRWRGMTQSEHPLSLTAGEAVMDALDHADLLSEAEHSYQLEGALGFMEMKLLPYPGRAAYDLWDAGRIIPQGAVERATLSGREAAPGRLILRVAPARAGRTELTLNGTALGTLSLTPGDAWQELSVDIPADLVSHTNQLELRQVEGERIIYHLWLAQELARP